MELLYQTTGYTFKNVSLLKLALTHCSAGKDNNERLEFLGDSILGFVIADALYHRFPDAPEGELSRIRAGLVQKSTLAEIARELQLGDFLILGAGEAKTGGADRDSILADALEALITAIYLDSELQVCSAVVMSWFSSRLTKLNLEKPAKDSKTRLQELLQARKSDLPVYVVEKILGDDHQQEFAVSCSIKLLSHPVQGRGVNRKEAEQNAASNALQALGLNNDG